MAGSRVEKIGSIFTRVQGLLRSGAIKEADKPLWYDVYAAFPPKVEPVYNRKLSEALPKKLMYREDLIRAQFYKVYADHAPTRFDMRDDTPSLCQRFLDKYFELYKPGHDAEQTFNITADTLKAEGFSLKSVEEIKQEKLELQQRRAELAEERARKRVQMADILPTTSQVFGDGVVASADAEDSMDPELLEDTDNRSRVR